jgi:hypothetical protein
MGAAFYIVPERDVEGFDVIVSGKAVARCEQLDQFAELAGVRPLMEFFGQDPVELAEFLESEGVEPDPDTLVEERWFSAVDGLRSVRGILEFVAANPKTIPDLAAIVVDLHALESVLVRLETEGIRWHLAVDF